MIVVCSVRDWLYGVRNTEPEAESEPQTEAERLRVIYHMITVSEEEGGAGISVNHGEWKNVDAIFSLHDEETNSRCLREWSQKTFLSTEDLDRIRGQFGESVCDCFKALAVRWLTIPTGGFLLRLSPVVLQVLGLPCRVRVLLLVVTGVILHRLHYCELSLVYHLRGVLETSGG